MTLTALFLVLGGLVLSIAVAAVLAGTALILAAVYSPFPLSFALGEIAWQVANEFLLIAIPLFILMGEILLRAGIAQKMYAAMSLWLSWLPGGLMHANIGTCTLFSATSGSSVATAATVSVAACPEIDRRGYNEGLFLGTLAAGGTLGILIPPSINLIIYGLLTQSSVPELYLAGFLPGLLLALLFMMTIIVICWSRPEMGGQKITATWPQRLAALKDLAPPILLFVVVVGSIYAGVATPTEAASLGVVVALLLALVNRTLTLATIRAAVEGTLKTTAMIMLIVTAAVFLNFVLSAIGLTQQLVGLIEQAGLGAYGTFAVVVALYLVLGLFIEPMSLLIVSTPLVAPILFAFGFDPIWYGVVLMILLEMALITPPIGINLFVVQGVRGTNRTTELFLGVVPFLVAMILMVGILLAFPEVALWLPSVLG